MIYLTHDTVPSSLLYLGEEVDLCHRLLQRSRKYREIGEWDRALKAAQEAQSSSCSRNTKALRAAAFLHMADVYRERGQLGPALRCARDGYEIFSYQASLTQQHNEAVAAYSLGVIHHLLGNFTDALNWYQLANEKFEAAARYWGTGRMLSYIEICERMQAWIRSLGNCLVDEEEIPRFILPAKLMGEDDVPFAPVRLPIRGYLLAEDVIIENRAFQVRGLRGGPVLLPAHRSCRIFEVPEAAQPFVGAEEGDYVLMQRTSSDRVQANPRVTCGVVEGDAGAEFVHFRRDASGNVNLESMSTGRVIGGGEDKDLPLYSPLALLKPV